MKQNKNYRFHTDPATVACHPEKSSANEEVAALQARTTDLALQQNGCFLLSYTFHTLSCESKSHPGPSDRGLSLCRRREASRAHTNGYEKEPYSGTHWRGQGEAAALSWLEDGQVRK